MKISALLRKAADEHLWNPETNPFPSAESEMEVQDCCSTMTDPYSCVAVQIASVFIEEEPFSLLEAMGCPCDGTTAFNEFEFGLERQSVRYAWLHFAADVAEEEGL